MSGAVTAAGIAAATAIGTTAYTARQTRKSEQRTERATKQAAALSQTQQNDPVPNFRRRRRTTQGFGELAGLPTQLINNAGGGIGGGLLGQ